ncbi:hypothetical protein SDC9_149346 [bioreactor metagenome]|uniref:Uncharacterized protein n=1 Tax=bioreactor metagenome TaxID=1076179 RepID=A0A645ENL0_9ZZZZ
MAGGKGAFGHGNHAELDVLAVLNPVVAQQFQHLEELAEVQGLLISYHVKGFNEIVGVFPVNGGGQIPRGVKGGAVAAENNTWRHIVSRQIDDAGPVVQLQKAFSPKLVDNGLHFVLVEAFAGVAVEPHA